MRPILHHEPARWGICTGRSGSKTDPLFFNKGNHTEKIWYYDLSNLKVAKRKPLTINDFKEFLKLLPSRGDSENNWTVTRAEIEAKNYNLKAVNPNRKEQVDTRTPEDLLDIIEQKGKEVEEALAMLRKYSRKPWPISLSIATK